MRRYTPQGLITLPSKFATTITLSDPIANDQAYEVNYVLNLDHLMSYERTKWESITPDDPRIGLHVPKETREETNDSPETSKLAEGQPQDSEGRAS